MSIRTTNFAGAIAATAAVGMVSLFGAHATFAQGNDTNNQQPTMQLTNQAAPTPTSVTTTTTVTPVADLTVPTPGVPVSVTTTTVTYGATPYVPGWGGHLTKALIDLREARGYLNMPDKFDMADDDWAAVHHVSDAIKDAEKDGVYDGFRPYFTPAESVTISKGDRLFMAKKYVDWAKNELNDPSAAGDSTAADVIGDVNAASDSINKAMAADDWNQILTNDRQYLWDDPNWSNQ